MYRAIFSRVAHASASRLPSTAHQMLLAFRREDPMAFVHEPPAFNCIGGTDPARGRRIPLQVAISPGRFAFH